MLYNNSELCPISSRHGLIVFGVLSEPLARVIINCPCVTDYNYTYEGGKDICTDSSSNDTDDNSPIITYTHGQYLDLLLDTFFSLEHYGIYHSEEFEKETILDKHSLKIYEEQYFIKDNRFYVPVVRLPP